MAALDVMSGSKASPWCNRSGASAAYSLLSDGRGISEFAEPTNRRKPVTKSNKSNRARKTAACPLAACSQQPQPMDGVAALVSVTETPATH